MNWLKRFLEIKDDPPTEPAKENAMAVKMTRGVWTRNPNIEFPDVATMQRAYSLVSRHPASIMRNEEFAKEYMQYFGSDELAVLKASKPPAYDMVMSPNENWVQGNKVEIKATAPEPVAPPGFKFQEGMMGSHQLVPIQEQGFNETQLGQIYDHMLEALRIWSREG